MNNNVHRSCPEKFTFKMFATFRTNKTVRKKVSEFSGNIFGSAFIENLDIFFLSCNFLDFYPELQKIPLNNRSITIYAHSVKQKANGDFFVIFSFVYYQWVSTLQKVANYFEILKPRIRKLCEGNSKSWQTRMNEMMTRWRSLKIWQHSEWCMLLNKDLQILQDLAVWHR